MCNSAGCLAAFAGAGIAGASPSKVGWTAFRMALAGFIIPFIAVYNPAVLFIDYTIPQVTQIIISAIIGVYALAAFGEGYFLKTTNIVERIVLGISAVLMIIPGVITDITGLAGIAIVYLLQKTSLKKQQILQSKAS